MVNDWYKDAMTEGQLKEISDRWLAVCGSCDYGIVEHGCNCSDLNRVDPRGDISRLLREIGRLKRDRGPDEGTGKVSIRSVVLCNGPDCKGVEDLINGHINGILAVNYIQVAQSGSGYGGTSSSDQGTVRHFCSYRCIANFYQVQADGEDRMKGLEK
jgi:hypothetical protein